MRTTSGPSRSARTDDTPPAAPQAGATDHDLLLAEKLLAWAQEHEHIYLRQIYQFGPNSTRDAKTAKHLVSILEEHGWFIRVKGGMELDGAHRRDAWRVWRHA